MDSKRVLYADNDRDFLDARSEFLEKKGYQVIKAHSPEDAERILERDNIHLAILDIRMVDDNDEGDISGILLAKDPRFTRVPKIFVTGYPTYEAVREAYGSVIGGTPIALAFLSKKEGPKALIEAVDSAFKKEIGINWGLKIVWDEKGLLNFPNLVMLLESGLDSALLTARSSELEDLFRKLFPTDEQISIIQLNWLQNKCACMTLFAMNDSTSRQAIVIFGNWEAVNKQRTLAKGYLEKESGIFAKTGFLETLHYAAAAYIIADEGDALQAGRAYFQESGERHVRIALENLFKQRLSKCYQDEHSNIRKADLASIYRERLGIPIQNETFAEAQNKAITLGYKAQSQAIIKEFSLKEDEFGLVFNNGDIYRGPNPIKALFDANAFDKQPAVIASTFGGIKVESLLIDQESRVYLTDMSSITRSPILEDFISMESGFHFDGLGSLNLLTLLDFEKQIGELKHLNDQLPVGIVEPECRRSLTAIQTIRKMAAEIAGEALVPYLIGLFHYCIDVLIRNDPKILLPKYQTVKLVHRLMTASMIIAQIEKLKVGETETSLNSDEENGLQIDENSREVSIDGRELRLTQTEFKLLLFLFNNPNRLCTRDEILSNVFEIKSPSTRADKGLLNTHIDRLRKKIDLNPAKHRYIVTLRGEGYMLDLRI